MDVCKHGYPTDFFCLPCAYESRGKEIDRLRAELERMQAKVSDHDSAAQAHKENYAFMAQQWEDCMKNLEQVIGFDELIDRLAKDIPILPNPNYSQDVAFLACSIDSWRKEAIKRGEELANERAELRDTKTELSTMTRERDAARDELADVTFIKNQMTDMANGQRTRAEKAEEELTTCRAELEKEKNAFVIERTEHKKALEELATERREHKETSDALELACGRIYDYVRGENTPEFFRHKARGK